MNFGDFVASAEESNKDKEDGIKLSAEFQNVVSSVEGLLAKKEPAFVLVTGMAGTGKSTLLRMMRKKVFDTNLIVAAPTGISALNVGGETIHRAFYLNTTLCPESKKVKKSSWQAIRHLQALIIDEISMVRADVLDSVSKVIAREKKNDLPFGGVLVVAFGDLFQLPPVLVRKEQEEFYKLYKNRFFFGAECLKTVKPYIHELTKPFRQKDTEFLKLLKKIRAGQDLDQVVDKINQVCLRNDEGESLVLTPTNFLASQINDSKLKSIQGEGKSYGASWKGKYFEEKGDESLPAPKTLNLKIGAKVMFTKNSKDWVNGTLGTVIELLNNSVKVVTEDNIIHDVSTASWDLYKHKFDEATRKINAEVVASYTQFPLRLAWACTIHKSQGLTLDSCAIDLGSGAFEVGQVYVALSRCRSMDNLSLKRKLTEKDVRVSQDAVRFHQHFLNS